jgi:hypothetical protein
MMNACLAFPFITRMSSYASKIGEMANIFNIITI